MKPILTCLSSLIVAHVMFVAPAQLPSADEPHSSERCTVYAKIVLPVESPGEGSHPVVESWVAKKLR